MHLIKFLVQNLNMIAEEHILYLLWYCV